MFSVLKTEYMQSVFGLFLKEYAASVSTQRHLQYIFSNRGCWYLSPKKIYNAENDVLGLWHKQKYESCKHYFRIFCKIYRNFIFAMKYKIRQRFL